MRHGSVAPEIIREWSPILHNASKLSIHLNLIPMKELFFTNGEFISPLALVACTMGSMLFCLMLANAGTITQWLKVTVSKVVTFLF